MDATPIPIPNPEDAPSEPSSLLDRLTGIITGPSEVFDEVKNSPVRASNWSIPLILSCLAGIFYSIMAFSQPGVLRTIEDKQDNAIAQQVAAGKISQDAADKAQAAMATFQSPTFLKIVGAVGAVFASCLGLFLLAIAVWLLLKMASEAKLDYMKVVEVFGLALVIDIPQKIIRTWLVSWKENMLVTVSPTLFVDHPSMNNKRDIFLTFIDPIDFWWLAVLSLGISKVASISFQKAALICFGAWYGFRIIATVLTTT